MDGIPFYIDWISSDGGFGVEPVEGTKAGLRVHCLESRGEERNQGGCFIGVLFDVRCSVQFVNYDWLVRLARRLPLSPRLNAERNYGFLFSDSWVPDPFIQSHSMKRRDSALSPDFDFWISLFRTYLTDTAFAACLTVQLPTKCSIEGRVVQ
jgi:hypothetical protein